MEMTGDAQEYVRERWLQPLLDGTIRSGFSMTEPETAGAIRTLEDARRQRR